MPRFISTQFIQDLLSGVLKELLEAVKSDRRLVLEIRDKYINIYYSGGNLMKVEEKAAGKYKFSFNSKYLVANATKVNIGKQIISSADPMCLTQVLVWIEAIPHIKHEMDRWFTKHPKEERDYQQLVLHENNYGGAASDTDYYICDIEHNKDNGRFDMVAVKWPSKSADRKKNNNLKIAMIEMKYMDKAVKGQSGIIDHIIKMDSFLSKSGALKNLSDEMKDIFNLKIELGLLKGIKKIKSFTTDQNERPEFILLIANHDPEKSNLESELNSLLNSSVYASFKHKANLKIAIASYMGYGLYQECILDFEAYMKKYFDKALITHDQSKVNSEIQPKLN